MAECEHFLCFFSFKIITTKSVFLFKIIYGKFKILIKYFSKIRRSGVILLGGYFVNKKQRCPRLYGNFVNGISSQRNSSVRYFCDIQSLSPFFICFL